MKKFVVLLSLIAVIAGCYHIDGTFIPDSERISVDALSSGKYRVIDIDAVSGKAAAEQKDEFLNVTVKPDKSYVLQGEKDDDVTIMCFARLRGTIIFEASESTSKEAFIGQLILKNDTILLTLINSEAFDAYLEKNKDKPFVQSRQTIAGGTDYYLTAPTVQERWELVKNLLAVPEILSHDSVVQLIKVPASN